MAYINGHDHKGSYQEKNSIHYLTLQGMVETKKENSFFIIDLYPDRLQLKGFGRETSRTLYFKVTASIK